MKKFLILISILILAGSGVATSIAMTKGNNGTLQEMVCVGGNGSWSPQMMLADDIVSANWSGSSDIIAPFNYLSTPTIPAYFSGVNWTAGYNQDTWNNNCVVPPLYQTTTSSTSTTTQATTTTPTTTSGSVSSSTARTTTGSPSVTQAAPSPAQSSTATVTVTLPAQTVTQTVTVAKTVIKTKVIKCKKKRKSRR